MKYFLHVCITVAILCTYLIPWTVIANNSDLPDLSFSTVSLETNGRRPRVTFVIENTWWGLNIRSTSDIYCYTTQNNTSRQTIGKKTITLQQLPAGASESISVHIPKKAYGTTVQCTINSNRSVQESNYSNNSLPQTLRIPKASWWQQNQKRPRTPIQTPEPITETWNSTWYWWNNTYSEVSCYICNESWNPLRTTFKGRRTCPRGRTNAPQSCWWNNSWSHTWWIEPSVTCYTYHTSQQVCKATTYKGRVQCPRDTFSTQKMCQDAYTKPTPIYRPMPIITCYSCNGSTWSCIEKTYNSITSCPTGTTSQAQCEQSCLIDLPQIPYPEEDNLIPLPQPIGRTQSQSKEKAATPYPREMFQSLYRPYKALTWF